MDFSRELTVRAAATEDVDCIVGFSAAMAWETERRQLDHARLREGTLSLLRTPSLGFFMVAETRTSGGPVVVGQLMITYEWSDWRNGLFWWIQRVYVDPVWRRRGVFRGMHEAVLSQAKADPTVCGIRLYVEEGNEAAKAVYQRLGMSPSSYKVYEQDFVLATHTREHPPRSS